MTAIKGLLSFLLTLHSFDHKMMKKVTYAIKVINEKIMNRTICFLIISTLLFFVSCTSAQVKQPTELQPYADNAAEPNIKHDPIEDDPKYKNAFDAIDTEVDEILKDDPWRGHTGFGHVFWNTKKKLLKEKYGIDWRSPREMNPHIIFD